MRRLAVSLTTFALLITVAWSAEARKTLLVDLSKSTVFALDGDRLVRSLVINPGAGKTPTRPGSYRITQKVQSGYRSNLVDINNRPLRRGGLGAPMDFWMRLGGTGMGFHRSRLWKPSGNWGSHGCLRMSRAGARWLFTWASLGTPVEIVGSGSRYASAVSGRSKPAGAKIAARDDRRESRITAKTIARKPDPLTTTVKASPTKTVAAKTASVKTVSADAGVKPDHPEATSDSAAPLSNPEVAPIETVKPEPLEPPRGTS